MEVLTPIVDLLGSVFCNDGELEILDCNEVHNPRGVGAGLVPCGMRVNFGKHHACVVVVTLSEPQVSNLFIIATGGASEHTLLPTGSAPCRQRIKSGRLSRCIVSIGL